MSTKLSGSPFSTYLLVGRQAWQSVSLGRSTCRSACRRCSTSRGRCGARWTSWSAPRPSWAPPPPASVAFYSLFAIVNRANLCTAQFRARSPTSWSTKPSSSWRTRATLRTTHPWSSWCLHHGPAPRFLHVSVSVLFCLFVPNNIFALYLPLCTVSTQPGLTYL